MRIVDGVRIWLPTHVLLRILGNDHERNRLGRGVSTFALIPPENDHTVVLIGVRRHDQGHDPGQEIVSLCNGALVAGRDKASVPRFEAAVLVVVLVRRDPVVVGHVVVLKIERQLLQWRVLCRVGSRGRDPQYR